MNDNLVSVKNVSVEFDYQENFLSKKQKIQAVKNVSLDIKKKSFLGLVGESGSGKTTLGKAIFLCIMYENMVENQYFLVKHMKTCMKSIIFKRNISYKLNIIGFVKID